MGKRPWAHIFIATLLGSVVLHAEDEAEPPSVQIVVSVAEQKLALVKDGGLVRKYPVSTSKFGLGDSMNSYKTPLGHLRVCDKIGANLPMGAVLKSRNATGEILPANSPGRDPIVTRIMWLEGLESGNSNAKSRGIYIHGTVEEARLGQPVSYGCIRMRSQDVVELFDDVPEGTAVDIITEKLPRFKKPEAPKTELFASADTTTMTRVGPHGLVMIKTVRGGGAPVVETKTPPAAPVLAQAKPAVKPAAPALVEKTPAPVTKLAAAAPAPLSPVAGGPEEAAPTVIFKTPRVVTARIASAPTPIASREDNIAPAEPRVLLAMSGSILMSDFKPMPKAAPAPAPAPVVKPAPAPVAEAPKSAAVAEETPAAPRNVVLQVEQPTDLLSPAKTRSGEPLDALSAYLLNPPASQAPQFRIAFGTSVEAPEL